ncbi:LiaI-LiaF-like domain-containing protein [Pseudoxanthomonas sp. UC19_8]|uniref:LiaF transmembrane domain-containing protein n=1 Tax=Pseudoxanthomonas sp. UC19_8 TaxID=3350175 RepID=UPI0036D3788D
MWHLIRRGRGRTMASPSEWMPVMRRHLIPALILIVLGTLFLLENLGFSRLDVGQLIATWWPLLLILGGINLLLRRASGQPARCRDVP